MRGSGSYEREGGLLLKSQMEIERRFFPCQLA
jgi:hypothetical protein